MNQHYQPLIGITGSLIRKRSGSLVCQVGQAYITSIQKAGGIPMMIPVGMDIKSLDSLLSRLDGVLFTGGPDIDPHRFTAQTHPKVYGVSPARDALELALTGKVLADDKPVLAICRGIQVLNVTCGGELYLDIHDQMPNALKHDWFPGYPRDKLVHTVNLVPDSQLNEIYGADKIQVNSLHHQGISQIGKGLSATAYAPDGLVEGLEVNGKAFALGVQWHPESLPDDPDMQRLFRAFIEAC
ncbi:MAG: gamma-glutamyl-gamma-aminobutyrate hydrolase family protein [Chloroflexota bacterium]|nr:gamma-glutamyl-gamma-aminobutyrate hydrolase family protein [Chloroflexota bacterium]